MTLMLSRILTSLNHGAFFGLGSVVAASVVPKHKQASAVATMFMGLTLANIGGVPAATWLGETIGWRMSFLATAGLGSDFNGKVCSSHYLKVVQGHDLK